MAHSSAGHIASNPNFVSGYSLFASVVTSISMPFNAIGSETWLAAYIFKSIQKSAATAGRYSLPDMIVLKTDQNRVAMLSSSCSKPRDLSRSPNADQSVPVFPLNIVSTRIYPPAVRVLPANRSSVVRHKRPCRRALCTNQAAKKRRCMMNRDCLRRCKVNPASDGDPHLPHPTVGQTADPCRCCLHPTSRPGCLNRRQ